MFEKGRVVESGTFDELVAQDGLFAGLAKAQFMVKESPPADEGPLTLGGGVAEPEKT